MSKIEDLIKQYCPNGCEWKRLGDVEQLGWIELGRGQVLSKSYIQDNPGNFPVFSSAATNNGVIGRCNTYMFTDSRITWSIDGGGKFFYRNDPYYSVTNVCGWLKVNDFSVLNLRYLYFALMNEWSKKTFDYVHKAHPSVIREEYTIPVPPLPVQDEIVRILDKFTELEKELEKELEMRKKQYEVYRDELLNDDAYDGYTLPEISENCDSQRKPITSSQRVSGSTPYYGASGIVDYVDGYIFDGEYLLISEDGANLLARSTPIAFSISGRTWVNNHAHILKFENYYTQKWVEYYFNSIDLSLYVTGGAQPKLNQKNLNKIVIPVPSLQEQQRIVEILDTFDALTTDLTKGLPAEIKMRHQQYEYYRDYLFGLLKTDVCISVTKGNEND